MNEKKIEKIKQLILISEERCGYKTIVEGIYRCGRKYVCPFANPKMDDNCLYSSDLCILGEKEIKKAKKKLNKYKPEEIFEVKLKL